MAAEQFGVDGRGDPQRPGTEEAGVESAVGVDHRQRDVTDVEHHAALGQRRAPSSPVAGERIKPPGKFVVELVLRRWLLDAGREILVGTVQGGVHREAARRAERQRQDREKRRPESALEC